MIIVLVNDTVKKYLLKLPENEKKHIRNKFEFLETGIWDGGLKVKKLKGLSAKYILEARLDRGNRILFTLGRPQEDNRTLIVYVWGIVEHDDVSRKSKTIIPTNVPFLQFSDYEETLLENIDMEALDPAYFTQESITQKVMDESGGQKWYAMDEPEWKRIRMYRRDDLEFFLYLSPEQKEILRTPLPLMISGAAGSGKTTLAIYYLLNENLGQKKKLFITYNPLLKNYARELYHGLMNRRQWEKQPLPPEFYTFRELCLEIMGENRFPPAQEVDFNRFKQMLAAYPSHSSLDAVLLWEEIRGIIKGAVPRIDLHVLEAAAAALEKGPLPISMIKPLQEQFIFFSKRDALQAPDRLLQKYLHTDIEHFAAHIQTFMGIPEQENRLASMLRKTLQALKGKENIPFLSLAEYESLGKKKAPNFNFNRTEIYRIFQWYQDKLETENLWDEADLIPQTVPEKYNCDILVCDEVQDFTDTQLNLLFKFVKNPNNIFLAGDTKQIVNPSSFRWEEARKHFYERGLPVPELKILSLNFRSSGSIVQLSNLLLQLKEKFIGKKAEETVEEWRYKGRPVTVISGIEADGPGGILEILKNAGAQRTILTRRDEEKETLKKRLGTELVFTIKEAKGLEFDAVVLWKFCADPFSEDIWKATLDIGARKIHEAHIRHEIDLLYVGITRSRQDLLIYDGPTPSRIWQSAAMRDIVYITEDRDFIRGAWETVSTPEEWEEQGRYYFEREYYKAAAECFKNAGNTSSHTNALAHYFRQAGNFGQAALHFEKNGDKSRAAECYEKAGEYKKAIALWEQLHQGERVFDLRPQLLKQEGNFSEAGALYLGQGKYPEAVECFKTARKYRQAADIYLEHLKDEQKAAEYYENARDFQEAAGLYLRLNMEDKAAELYARAKNYRQAETLWLKVGNNRQLLALYKETNQEDKLFAIYEKEGYFEQAVKYLRKEKMNKTALQNEAEEFFKRKEYFKALIRFHVLDAHDRIADCYKKMGKYKDAALHLEEHSDFQAAAVAYYKAGEYIEAFKLYVAHEDPKKDFVMARKVLKKIADKKDLEYIGMKYYKDKEWERALFIFSEAGIMPSYEGFCHLFLGDKKKAFEIWFKKALTYFNLHIIAHESIEHQVYEAAAEFYLTLPYYGWHFDFFYFERKSPPWAVMVTYFGEHPELKEEMSRWGRFLAAGDSELKNRDDIFRFLGDAGDFVGLVIYTLRYIKGRSEKIYKAILHHYKKQAPSFEEKSKYESAAFCYFILEQPEPLARILSKLTITPFNFCFFLGDNLPESKRREVYQWSIDNDARAFLREYLVVLEDRAKLEELYKYEAELKGEKYEEGEWDWESERINLYLEKFNKQGKEGDYSFFNKKDMERILAILEERQSKRLQE